MVTVYFESKHNDGNVIKSLYKNNTPVVSYIETHAEQERKTKFLLKMSAVFAVISIVLFVIRKKIPAGAILLAFTSVILIATGIMTTMELYKTGNTSHVEYLKVLVIMLFAMITIFSTVKMLKPDFELLSLFNMSTEQKKKLTETMGLLVIIGFTIQFLYSLITGYITGEVYYFFSNANSGWVQYQDNQALYLWGMAQSLFGSVVFLILLFWIIKKKIT